MSDLKFVISGECWKERKSSVRRLRRPPIGKTRLAAQSDGEPGGGIPSAGRGDGRCNRHGRDVRGATALGRRCAGVVTARLSAQRSAAAPATNACLNAIRSSCGRSDTAT